MRRFAPYENFPLYCMLFQKHHNSINWCNTRGVNPISCPVEVVNFLECKSLNASRLAISWVHDKVDPVMLDNIQWSQDFWRCLPPNAISALLSSNLGCEHSSLFHLLDQKRKTSPSHCRTCRIIYVVALTRPTGSANLTWLGLNCRTYSVEGVTFEFLPTALFKQSRQQIWDGIPLPPV